MSEHRFSGFTLSSSNNFISTFKHFFNFSINPISCGPDLLCADEYEDRLEAAGLDRRTANCDRPVGISTTAEFCFDPCQVPGFEAECPCDCDDGKLCTEDSFAGGICPDDCVYTPKECPEGQSCSESDGLCYNNVLLRPCIAVIDESSLPNAHIETLWANFRVKYPLRPFCLLQPQIPQTSNNFLHRPPAFDADSLTTFSLVNRDVSTGIASDWLSICGINGSTGIDFVALFVDISGSMDANTVALSRAKFETDLGNLGVAFCDVLNDLEDWITPFDADLAVYDPVTGLCSGA